MNKSMLSLIISFSVISTYTMNNNNSLHVATKSGNIELVRQLLVNANINAKDEQNYTPLHWAAFCNYPKIAELLIAHGADLNIQNSLGNTPLHKAAEYGYIEIVKLFIKHCNDLQCYDAIAIKNDTGQTPEQIAATMSSENHENITKKLLEVYAHVISIQKR